jgi:glycosyltransferase involved in cell wall biosynthesis
MKKILVRGPALSQSGYGEHTRFLLRSLRSQEAYFDVYLINVNWGNTSWIWKDDEERTWIDSLLSKTISYMQSGGQFDVSAQVTIPGEWEKLAPINIGVTAGIETTKISPQWVEKSLLMDKIIVVSEHSKYGFDNTEYEAVVNNTGEKFMAKTTCPVEVVNFPVKNVSPKKLKLNLKHDFNFLVVATWIPRKNLENTIRWFVEEFKDKEVGLVLKTSMAKNCIRDREITKNRLAQLLAPFKDRKCSVHLLHGDMTEEEMSGLYKHRKIKCLVNIAHGEGFGLPMFESAYNGLPVLSINWGGQLDFLNMPVKQKNGKSKLNPMFQTVSYDIKRVQKEAVWDTVIQPDSMWAFAREWDYKKTLRSVFSNYKPVQSQAKKLQKYLLEELSEEKQFLKMAEVVNGEPITSVSVKDLPKISIVTSIFDGDNFIEPFLEDITRQTIFKDKCELILINANSPGNEEETINKYLKKYPDNIVYKKLDEDPGIYGVWNMGVELATGEYITNANLDDRKRPDSLEKHATSLFLNDDIDLVYSDMVITDKPNETWESNSSNGRRYNMADFSFENLLRGNMPHAAPMWKKTIHEKHGLFDEKYKSAGDWEMWLRAASNGSVFKKISSVTNLYYFNPKGISTNPENYSWKREEEKSVFRKYKKIKSESEIKTTEGLIL